jgi:predicted lipid-binding transport protein (Tim44 family)
MTKKVVPEKRLEIANHKLFMAQKTYTRLAKEGIKSMVLIELMFKLSQEISDIESELKQ